MFDGDSLELQKAQFGWKSLGRAENGCIRLSDELRNSVMSVQCFFLFFFLMFSFIWLPRVLVVALGIFSCSIWDLGFPGGSADKESARRPGFDPLVGRIPWRRAWQPTPVFLHGESLQTEEPSELQSMGSQRVGHD